ncbi:MAG: hypothetical protein QG604_669 [Candidatus Dependentiae bacterium]|nr:hypothetical protein [Candidatus Dependentiae bacterium]
MVGTPITPSPQRLITMTAPVRPRFRAQRVSLSTGLGTHIDAPAHCVPGGKTVDQIAFSRFFAPIVVINVADKAHDTYIISAADILAFEKEHGPIGAYHHVFFHTGWSRHWTTPEHYQNECHFPTLSPEAARLIVARQPYSVGIDTTSVDRPGGNQYPAHEILLQNDCYIIENLTSLDKVPATGAMGLMLPLILVGAVEGPARVIAICRS